MHVVFDGMAVASFQQVVADFISQLNAPGKGWNFPALLTLRGHVFGPTSTEMFAVHGEQRERVGLIDLLQRSVVLQVSNGRDRLYGLMHLANDYHEGRIIVDYSKTEEQVMADAAAYHISEHRDLKFLDETFRDNETNLPTWIPERWVGHDSDGIGLSWVDDPEPRYTECPLSSVDMGNMRLRIRGVKVDWVRQSLVPNAKATVAGFWKSQLGKYLQPYLEDTSTGLPLEFSRAMRGGMYDRTHGHESIHTGLSHLWDIGNAPDQASRDLGYGGDGIQDLLAPLKNGSQPAWSALRDVLRSLYGRSCIIMDNGHMGQVPKCNIREEDEIWLVLGCTLPVVVRRQPNGRYRHICTAWIPAFKEHEDIAHFVSEIQSGDKVGEWTVEDVELE